MESLPEIEKVVIYKEIPSDVKSIVRNWNSPFVNKEPAMELLWGVTPEFDGSPIIYQIVTENFFTLQSPVRPEVLFTVDLERDEVTRITSLAQTERVSSIQVF
jgi:hypothetical protein